MKRLQALTNDLENKNKDLHNLLTKVKEDHQKEVGDLKASLRKVGQITFEKPSSSKTNYVKRTYNYPKTR